MNYKILFSQTLDMTPQLLPQKKLSLENDFAFVNKMFVKTNNNIQKALYEFKTTTSSKTK